MSQAPCTTAPEPGPITIPAGYAIKRGDTVLAVSHDPKTAEAITFMMNDYATMAAQAARLLVENGRLRKQVLQ